MSVNYVQKTVKVAKEVSEVMDALSALVACIKSKGDYASLLPAVLKAVDGVGDVPAEVKEEQSLVINAAFMGASDIVNTLLTPAVPVVQPV